MKLEICTESFATAIYAAELGIDRIELCSALNLGGLTPSFGLIAACVQQSKSEIHVMIRHKQGDFVYSDEDILIMTKDIEMAKEAGAKGAVFGCLTSANEIDIEQTEILTRTAKNLDLEVTFHRAFDFISTPQIALEKLITLGIDRILSSGGAEKAVQGIELIRTLVEVAKNRIQIMAGSGINAENANLFQEANVDAIHFSGDFMVPKLNDFGMGFNIKPDQSKIRNLINR